MQEAESIDKTEDKDTNTQTSSVFYLISQFTRKSYKGSEHPSKRWGQSVVLNNKSMVIFGGRHSLRCLSNIYSLSFQTLNWNKIEQIGMSPPARESHSAIMYNGDMFIFGGSGNETKLNDLWSFSFIDKRWTKQNSQGDIPSPCDGHLTGVIDHKYMMVYGGLDSNDKAIRSVYLLDLNSLIWITTQIEGEEPSLRDSQSCGIINNNCYFFGGQGEKDKLFNDMYLMSFDINEQEKQYKAIMSKEVTQGQTPSCRSSHTCVSYNNRYIFIIGGEGEEGKPLNDIWMYDTQLKTYSEIKIENNETFEPRFCHSSILYGDVVAIYGGMQTAEVTLDSLVLLSYENKSEMKTILTADSNLNETKMENDQIKLPPQLPQQNVQTQPQIKQSLVEEIGTDTSDLCDQKAFSFEEIKKNYINNLISWTFLKKLSEFNQWPLGCIGNFISNSLKEQVNAKNIFIDVKCFSETGEAISKESIKEHSAQLSNSNIILTINDDGKGISCVDFNQIMYSFAQNENKEYNYFQFGISMKSSAMRLADSFLLISKTETEASIGIISKNLQNKIDTDLILTLIVNYKIIQKDSTVEYVAKSNYPNDSIALIFEQISFLFKTNEELFNYFDSFQTGTHIFLYDLNQLSSEHKDIGQLSNYELFFDFDKADILYNHFYTEFGDINFIDASLIQYLNFNQIVHNQSTAISLFGTKLLLSNPLHTITQMTKISNDSLLKISSLKINDNDLMTDCICINSDSYKGVLFNRKFINDLIHNSTFELNKIKDNDFYNGVLIYKNNQLISRMSQNKIGDVSYFINKYSKKNIEGSNLFKINGYIELPSKGYDLTFSKTEIRDQSVYGFLFMKMKGLLQHINKS